MLSRLNEPVLSRLNMLSYRQCENQKYTEKSKGSVNEVLKTVTKNIQVYLSSVLNYPLSSDFRFSSFFCNI